MKDFQQTLISQFDSDLKDAWRHFTVTALRAGASLCICCLCAIPSAVAQITNVTNNQAVPTPGVGHDYIGTINDIVTPANGSLSIRIPLPLPPGRGITLPLQLVYNSNGVFQFNPLTAYGDSRFLEQNGWGVSVPQLSAQYIQLPGNSTSPAGAVCPVYSEFVFSDSLGTRHSMNIGLPDYPICNSTGLATGYSLIFSDQDYDGSYFISTPASKTGENDAQGLPFSVSDNDGLLYYFPSMFAAPGCIGVCNVPEYIEDRNGNEMQFKLAGGGYALPLTITDTAGRTMLTVNSFGSSSGDTINVSGVVKPYILNWKSQPYNFSVPTTLLTSPACNESLPASSASGTMPVVTSITLPNLQTYQFSYDPEYGLVSKITYPTGAFVEYTWGPSNEPSDAYYYDYSSSGSPQCAAIYDAPAILHRYVSFDGQTIAQQQDFSYSTNFNGSSTWSVKQTIVTTTDFTLPGNPKYTTAYTYSPVDIYPLPDTGPDTSVYSESPVENTTSYYDFNGKFLGSTTKSWVGQATNPVLGEEDTTSGSGLTSKMVLQRDSFNNVIEEDDYDFGQSTQSRTTVNTYQSFPARSTLYAFPTAILDKPCKTVVHAGTSSGTRVAETDTEYDGGTTVCGTPGTPSVNAVPNLPQGTHDVSNFGPDQSISRGNASTITRWSNIGTSPTTTYTYDETGQILSMTDPCGNGTCSDMLTGSSHTTNYSYSDDYTVLSDGSNVPYAPSVQTNTYLTKITNPLGQIENFSYDYYTGQLTAAQDQNDINASRQGTTYVYNDPLERLTTVNYPDGGQTIKTYVDSALPTVTTCQLVNGTAGANCSATSPPQGWKTSVATMDGMGHEIETQLVSDPYGTDVVNMQYDGEGNVASVTNPCRGSSPPSNSTITYGYDSLRRKILETEQDGSKQQWCYDGVPNWLGTANCSSLVVSNSIAGSITGTWVDYTDQNGNHWQRASDSFGRLTQIVEPNGLSQVPSMQTTYNYDVLGDLLLAQQNGTSGDTARSRSFVYDSLSRLQTAQNPETGIVSYIYDLNGNLWNKTDAREIMTSFSYDALNRLTSKSYSLNDVSKTPISCFQYDTSSATGAGGNLIGRLTNEWTAAAGSSCVAPPSGSYYALRSILSYDPMGRIANEQQCTLVNCFSGSGPALSYNYDFAGNPTGLTNSVGAVNGGGKTMPLALTTGFDAAAHMNGVTSDWPAYSTNLYTLNNYGPVGPLNWSLGPTSPSPTLTVTLGYSNRLWVNSISAVGQIP